MARDRRGAASDGLGHVAAALGVAVIVVITAQILVGLVWLALILERTGRRRRDLLLVLVPGVNLVILAVSAWRYTAPEVTWPVRPDRESRVLDVRWRRLVPAAALVLAAVFAVAAAVEVRGVRERSWLTVAARQSLVGEMIDDDGLDPAKATCVADRIDAELRDLDELESLSVQERAELVAREAARC